MVSTCCPVSNTMLAKKIRLIFNQENLPQQQKTTPKKIASYVLDGLEQSCGNY
jgi:hypothetical protein